MDGLVRDDLSAGQTGCVERAAGGSGGQIQTGRRGAALAVLIAIGGGSATGNQCETHG